MRAIERTIERLLDRVLAFPLTSAAVIILLLIVLSLFSEPLDTVIVPIFFPF